MKIVYMGTPEIAAVILESLIAKGEEIAAVVTQPDKPKGRGYEMSFSKVKQTALSHGLTIYQPTKVKDEEFLALMEQIAPDLIVVAAFGQILPKRLLDLPKYGCINVHASLLPKYRGAAPIQYAILNGESETGVTIQYMAEGLDTGDILTKEIVPIAKDETGGSLYDKLAVVGARVLDTALDQIAAGSAFRTPQDEAGASYVGTIKKEMGQLDFSHTAKELERKVRAFDPWPGTYAYLNGKMLKFWSCEEIRFSEEELQRVRENAWGYGSILRVKKDSFAILTREGGLLVKELQLEGKRRMRTEEFLRGYPLKEGIYLMGTASPIR